MLPPEEPFVRIKHPYDATSAVGGWFDPDANEFITEPSFVFFVNDNDLDELESISRHLNESMPEMQHSALIVSRHTYQMKGWSRGFEYFIPAVGNDFVDKALDCIIENNLLTGFTLTPNGLYALDTSNDDSSAVVGIACEKLSKYLCSESFCCHVSYKFYEFDYDY